MPSFLPALYAPIVAMLLDWCFAASRSSSGGAIRLIAHAGTPDLHRLHRRDFRAGVTLGALLQGIEINGRAYAGGYWDWITLSAS